jgi:hypothetical protein
MRIDWNGRASSLRPRNRTVYGAARHSEPKTPFDEQPAGSAPGGLGDGVSAPFASATAVCAVCVAVLPKVNDTISNQRLN